MRSILNSNLRLWHLVALSVFLVVLTSGTMAFAQSVPQAFWPNGNIRLASAQNDDTISITGSNNPSVRVLRATITVPSGKVADLQATFTADLHHGGPGGTYAYCFGEFRVDGSANNFNPGSYQLLGGQIARQPDAVSVAMSGIRKNVGPGTHNVDVFINSAYEGCTLFARAMTVVADVH